MLFYIDKEVLRACGIEIAEVGIIVDAYVWTQRMPGAIEIEVAVGAVGIFSGVADEVTAEAVAHPHT